MYACAFKDVLGSSKNKSYSSNYIYIYIYIWVNKKKLHWWVCPFLFNSSPRVFFVLLGWLVRWEVTGRTVASRIYSKQHVAFLFSSYLAFYQCVSLASRWCIHSVVLTEDIDAPVLAHQQRTYIHTLYADTECSLKEHQWVTWLHTYIHEYIILCQSIKTTTTRYIK